jgi:hypothetical protein
MATMSNSALEDDCKLTDDERCGAAIERHRDTTIQRIAFYDAGRCTKRGKTTLRNKAGKTRCFCGNHARMALEGKIGPDGDTMSKADRNECGHYGTHMFYEGEWTECPDQ